VLWVSRVRLIAYEGGGQPAGRRYRGLQNPLGVQWCASPKVLRYGELRRLIPVGRRRILDIRIGPRGWRGSVEARVRQLVRTVKLSALESEVVVHDSHGSDPVVECILRGQHAEGTAGHLAEVLQASVKQHRPSILIINLLDFHYRFGDDIGGALVTGRGVLHRHCPSASCRILARLGTAKALASLMELGKIFSFFGDRLFSDLESAVADARAEASSELSN